MGNLISCNTCGKDVSINAHQCVHCGEVDFNIETIKQRQEKEKEEAEKRRFKGKLRCTELIGRHHACVPIASLLRGLNDNLIDRSYDYNKVLRRIVYSDYDFTFEFCEKEKILFRIGLSMNLIRPCNIDIDIGESFEDWLVASKNTHNNESINYIMFAYPKSLEIYFRPYYKKHPELWKKAEQYPNQA